MAIRSRTDAFISLLREHAPDGFKQSTEVQREAVQTTVWVVGLASGLLALLVANNSLALAVTPSERHVLVPALLATVLLGVVQRAISLLAEFLQRQLALELEGYLSAITAEYVEPLELSASWDRDFIIEELQRGFDLDYSFLRKYDTPLEVCRQAYKVQYDMRAQHDRSRSEAVALAVGAYSGWSEERSRRTFLHGRTAGKLVSVRARARRATLLQWSALICSALCLAAFAVASGVLARVALVHAP